MTRFEQVVLAFVGSVAAVLPGCRGGGGDPVPERTVVFVCEHGSAKSVIAAALFNVRASDRKLPFRAESRGVVPDRTLMPAAVAGLRSDGLAPGQTTPIQFGRADADRAAVIVAVDPLPLELAAPARVRVWDAVPPVSVAYAASRDAMRSRIDALLDELDRDVEAAIRKPE